MAHEADLQRWRDWYARLLRLYPPLHRSRYAESMTQTFNDLLRERARDGRSVAGLGMWLGLETGVAIVKANLDTVAQHGYARRPAIVTGGLLLIPLVMTYLDREKPLGQGWRWEPMSFVVMGLLLFGAGLVYEVLARRIRARGARAALFLAVAGAVLVIWAQLAVQAVSKGLTLLFGG
jgi:hypothetical protein